MSTNFSNLPNMMYQIPESVPSVDVIPTGFYSLDYDPDNVPGAYYLTPKSAYTLPPVIYGDNNNYAQLIMETFEQRKGVFTTAALSGLKGSGKTLCAQELAILAVQKGYPVIEISGPFCGTRFNTWMNKIKQPVVLFYDEFDKNFKDEKLDKLLTFLDGPSKSHKLVLLTMNDVLDNTKYPFFFNRPGRVYFNIVFEALSLEIINQYCQDNLVHKTKLNDIINFTKRFNHFTIDILTILVKELNKNEAWDCEYVSKLINIKPDLDTSRVIFDVVAYQESTQKILDITLNSSALSNGSDICLPFNFAMDVLSNEYTSFSIPLYSFEDYFKYQAYFQSRSGHVHSPSSLIIKDIKGEMIHKELRNLKELMENHATMEDKYIGYADFHVSLNDFEHIQDPVTRYVTLTHKPSGICLRIQPVDYSKPKKLSYTF